jgi:hypothetical protein
MIGSATAQEFLEQALRFLYDEYNSRVAASDLFPPQISAADVRRSVARYEDEMSTATKRDICASCGKTVPIHHIHEINDDDPILQPLNHVLDNCGWHNNIWDLCSSCHASLTRHTIPKFSAKNLVNVMSCQHYPSSLNDLTAVEECLIARSHPLGVILKLRPGGVSAPINYHALRGHFILIPQDPGPLLQILPSSELRLQNLIKVFWLGTDRPAVADLNPFLLIRKTKVLAALEYLVQHNHLYHNVIINHSMIDNWTEQFVPTELQDNIICLNEGDHHEREGYTINPQSGNYENDLQAAQDEGDFDNNSFHPLMTASVSTDINGERQDPNMRMLQTLFQIVSNHSTLPHHQQRIQHDTHKTLPVISYTVDGKITLLDNWTEPSYFTSAFPTLFPTGIGGHLDERSIPISIDAFAEWALSHHSKRHVPFEN